MDYLFRRLALDYLPYETREEYGIFTADERTAQVAESYGAAPAVAPAEEDVDVESLRASAPVESSGHTHTEDEAPHGVAKPPKQPGESRTAVDAPLCFTCGVSMRPAGSCYVCEQCGSTSGCS
jgi:ribonucleoside-diphosphate reductase alpha chain